VVTKPKPDLVYAQVVANPQSADSGMQGHDEVISPIMRENNAVIYSELENIDAASHTVAPSNDLYANVF